MYNCNKRLHNYLKRQIKPRYLSSSRDFLVRDLFDLESKGSVNTNFLCCGVSGSLCGTRTHMLMMSAMFISAELNAQCFNVK